MHAGIVDIQVMQNASMRSVELQSWGRHVWNFSYRAARTWWQPRLDLRRDRFAPDKNFSELDLAGEGAQDVCRFYLASMEPSILTTTRSRIISCAAHDQRFAVQRRIERQEPLGVAGHDLCRPWRPEN